jgi:hypothetical protein
MDGKRGRWWRGCAGLVLLLGLLAPSSALAGPYLGEWGWHWNPAGDCPPGAYSPLHYWARNAYIARAWFHPSNLDQYPPGPCASPPISYEYHAYPCRSTPPAPSTPYGNPVGYYGRPVNLPFVLP